MSFYDMRMLKCKNNNVMKLKKWQERLLFLVFFVVLNFNKKI